MKRINLLDCTLRDGGYVNNWLFGKDTISRYSRKIAETGIEMFEIGFIKGKTFDENKCLFPDIKSITPYIQPKNKKLCYVGMIDMGSPVDLENIPPYDGTSVDAIRIIFKKDKMKKAYEYAQEIIARGYKTFINFVSTDQYSDEEFIAGIKLFNTLSPYAMAIVDTFGLIKRKQFLRLVYLADNNMLPSIALCYHAHNNLQQAMGNAEALVELNLKRDICIDACIFGMGRGAGNLNLELFADYLNENYDTCYRIEPMLEIMDEHLNDIYRKKPWGYSLPLYLSACTGCHPNYALHLAEKDSLTVKSFNELLKGIPPQYKAVYDKEAAERLYSEFQDRYIDDSETLRTLAHELQGQKILLLAPGKSIIESRESIITEIKTNHRKVIALNFTGAGFPVDFIFSSNLKRYCKIEGTSRIPCIVTSNIPQEHQAAYRVNYSSYTSQHAEIIDNSGLMALRLLLALGVKEVAIAGMDGYSNAFTSDYLDNTLSHVFEQAAETRNKLISKDLADINKHLRTTFVTPTQYTIQT